MNLNKKKRKQYWRWLIAGAIFLCFITFTPLVTPYGIYKPMLFGIPYTLWVGFVITVLLVLFTYLGTKVHPGMGGEEDAG